ncbi:MAG: biotin/lipoyl-binding protein [Lachnospiraceae bacterium]|nr:biotin/lipoyl-binding protein [Lachnospiraceae bacterium]
MQEKRDLIVMQEDSGVIRVVQGENGIIGFGGNGVYRGGLNKRRIIYGFLIFLGLMWLCTVISKSIYASKLPVVLTDRPAEKYIEHIVETDGIVVAGEKKPLTVLSGVRVEKILVQVGDKVEEGDILFTVDLDDLKESIKEKEIQISKLQLQVDTLNQNAALASQKKTLEEERAREDYDEQARYYNDLVGRAAEEVNKIEKKIEEAGGEEASEELKEALKAAAYAEADAKRARDNIIKEAGRRVEDILLPDNTDSTLASYKLELAGLQEELAKYKEIESNEGQISSKAGGFITDINISEGNRVSDSAVMLLADESIPYQFKATIDKEQKKYVGLKDKVSLKLEGVSRDIDLSVENLAESETMPGNYEINMDLPEGIGMPGLSGTIRHSEPGDKYYCCVDPYAVYENNGRTYVYVVKEREGILGMEYYIEEVNVKVLDQNENWAALQGALDSDSQVVISATKAIKNGDIVRF